MSNPLRVDGDFTIYRVEVLFYPDRGEEGWSPAGEHQIAQVPVHLRFANPEKYDGKHNEPFESFSSSGDCWQETGVHGTYDRTLGVQMLDLLARYNPKYKLRLVKMRVSQKRILVMEAEKDGGEDAGQQVA